MVLTVQEPLILIIQVVLVLRLLEQLLMVGWPLSHQEVQVEDIQILISLAEQMPVLQVLVHQEILKRLPLMNLVRQQRIVAAAMLELTMMLKAEIISSIQMQALILELWLIRILLKEARELTLQEHSKTDLMQTPPQEV